MGSIPSRSKERWNPVVPFVTRTIASSTLAAIPRSSISGTWRQDLSPLGPKDVPQG